jgi:hypothetical protein
VVGGGSVQASALFGSLLPCFRETYFGLCAVVDIGGQPVNGVGLANPAHTTAPLIAVGGRVLGELPLSARFSLRLALDVMAPVTRTTLDAGTAELWTTPAIAGDALLLLALRLL